MLGQSGKSESSVINSGDSRTSDLQSWTSCRNEFTTTFGISHFISSKVQSNLKRIWPRTETQILDRGCPQPQWPRFVTRVEIFMCSANPGALRLRTAAVRENDDAKLKPITKSFVKMHMKRQFTNTPQKSSTRAMSRRNFIGSSLVVSAG